MVDICVVTSLAHPHIAHQLTLPGEWALIEGLSTMEEGEVLPPGVLGGLSSPPFSVSAVLLLGTTFTRLNSLVSTMSYNTDTIVNIIKSLQN